MAGRPREFDRSKALERARDAFWARGFEGTSMADLVTELGLASARIYAAFGSKEALFREAIELYEAKEGGFATRALEEEPTVRRAIERIFQEAVETYTRPGKAKGCMVVSAGASCAAENDAVMRWLVDHRRARTQSIIDRLGKAAEAGELKPDTDINALGDWLAALLHGLSVQARDGVPRTRLLALITPTMQVLDAARARPASRSRSSPTI